MLSVISVSNPNHNSMYVTLYSVQCVLQNTLHSIILKGFHVSDHKHIQQQSNCISICVGEMEKLVSYLISFTFAIFLAFHIILRDRPFNLKVMVYCFVQNFFSNNTRVRIFCFSEFNIRLYDKNSESDFFFSSTKILSSVNMLQIYWISGQ